MTTLPKGYDTELGDTLSGGERQRIGLARAFLHDAKILLLDEPTSNLDSLNEAIILKAIKEERENKIILLVSHRPSTLGIAEKTWHMEEGGLTKLSCPAKRYSSGLNWLERPLSGSPIF